MEFEASFDVTNVPPGETSLQVVACGAFNLAGTLARGEAEQTVRVQSASPSTTTTVASPTTVRAPANPPLGAGATTTVAAVTTTRVGQTTTTSTPPTTAASEDAPPAAATRRAEPVRPRASDAPLVLTEAPDEETSGPPLWVGAVVGVSGGVGLLFSATSSWRRKHLPEPVEVLEAAETPTDLVDVR
jgi:hypothetical protein